MYAFSFRFYKNDIFSLKNTMQTVNFNSMFKHVALGLTLTILVQLMFTISPTEQRALHQQQHQQQHNANSLSLSNDLSAKAEAPKVSSFSSVLLKKKNP